MIEVSKTWQQLRGILLGNNLYFNYEDSGDGRVRRVYTVRDSCITYVCTMQLTENPSQDSDQYDFDENWKIKAGEKKYVYQSHKFDVSLSNGEFTYDFKIKANDETTDVEAFLYKGLVDVSSAAQRGDRYEVQVVDIDNILGYGDGTVVGYMVRNKFLSGGAQVHTINPPKYDYLTSKRKILAGLWVRFKYIGSGQPNVIIDYEYEY